MKLRTVVAELQQKLEASEAKNKTSSDSIAKLNEVITYQSGIISNLQQQIGSKTTRTTLEKRGDVFLYINNSSIKSGDFIRQAIDKFQLDVTVKTVRRWLKSEIQLADRFYKNSHRRLFRRPYYLLEAKVYANVVHMVSEGVLKHDIYYDDLMAMALHHLTECRRRNPYRYDTFVPTLRWAQKISKR